jgi:acyl-CoA thioester hydrolase
MKHQADYRVYYEDTDAGGIMYHGNFINFCERGRSELLRHVGIPASEVWDKTGVGFVVRHIDAEYTAMVKLDDLLNVFTVVTAMKNSSFTMEQEVFCQNKAVFKMDVTIVCIDKKGKPTRIPDALREKFKDYIKDED